MNSRAAEKAIEEAATVLAHCADNPERQSVDRRSEIEGALRRVVDAAIFEKESRESYQGMGPR